MNLQVSSAVPEGKGVSSSASVEVASMSAVAAAHGNHFDLSTSLINCLDYSLYNLITCSVMGCVSPQQCHRVLPTVG